MRPSLQKAIHQVSFWRAFGPTAAAFSKGNGDMNAPNFHRKALVRVAAFPSSGVKFLPENTQPWAHDFRAFRVACNIKVMRKQTISCYLLAAHTADKFSQHSIILRSGDKDANHCPRVRSVE